MPATDDQTRARLVALIGACRHNAKAEEIADALLAAHVTLPEPPEWPVTDDALRAAFTSPGCMSRITDDAWRVALAAAAPHLWRAKVESLTEEEMYRLWRPGSSQELHAALLALAGGER